MAIASLPEEIAGAAATPCGEISAEALLAWRRAMLKCEPDGPAAAADLDWLLDLAGGVRWTTLQSLLLHPGRRVRLDRPLLELEALWRRHRGGAEPLQYLVGRCPWRDLELQVAPGVLIPRQETEQLAELALQLAPQVRHGAPLCWADLGTGSGCLALALARGLPGSCGLAVDASAEALQQAAANLESLLTPGVAVLAGAATAPAPPPDPAASPPSAAATAAADLPAGPGSGNQGWVALRLGHWWQAIEPWWGRLDLVVSNPPYIPSAVLAGLDPVVRDHEPWLALDGGADGLVAIRTIVAGAASALAPGGLLLLEHHHDQSARVLELLEQAGLDDCRAHRDLEGVARFTSARRAGLAAVAEDPQGGRRR